MNGIEWILIFLAASSVLFYNRAAAVIWAFTAAILLLFMMPFGTFTLHELILYWLIAIVILLPLVVGPIRQQILSRPILFFYKRAMPAMSSTEREALAAGTVTFEGDLFSGAPSWQKLLNLPAPMLTLEEKQFLDGPVEELCSMLHDWDITHNRADMPTAIWDFLKEKGFFSLIIPKQFGGKAFSAYAQSQIFIKVYAMSATAAITIGVPNSLGPAELLLHYGTNEQKDFYLPRLARGAEIPCFALTGPDAGSDASAMQDTGIVCMGDYEGEQVLGIRLNFSKRYITLAPVATVIGMAFKLFDPEHLLGKKTNLGITCALVPRNTPNVVIGRRHFPLNLVFQNGPIQGKDVFIPVDFIIGGAKMAGHGWRMLMECLAAGRAITLPAGSAGGTKALAFATGAYARIRRQFNVPVGYFEGVQEALARIAGNTYVVDAARSFTAAAIDAGAKPAIASAIIKYHTTELGRQVTNDAMDIHGGKGICLGPNNYLGRGHESVPIAITVEGANILTRSLIIFGQGAMRCHPYIFAEFTAAEMPDKKESLVAFDKVIAPHLAYTFSNFVRSKTLAWTGAFFTALPRGKTRKYFRQLTRFSAAFALLADMSLLLLGGALKRKESISARLGDILSYQYLLSAVLKHFHDQQQPADDLPLIKWIAQTNLYQQQQTIAELLRNLPNRFFACLMHLVIFPFGKNFTPPKDKLTQQVATLLLTTTATRARLAEGIFLTPTANNLMAKLENALIKIIAAEPIEKSIREAIKAKAIKGNTWQEQIQFALEQNIISDTQFNVIDAAEKACQQIIAVDDFAPADLVRVDANT
jgi:acyl-CoA dehydrogenase